MKTRTKMNTTNKKEAPTINKKKKRTLKQRGDYTRPMRFHSKIPSEEKQTQIHSDNSSFNDNPYVRESHNCYMYFLNKKNDEVVQLCKTDYPKHKLCRRAQPGYVSGYPILNKTDYKCPKIMKRTLADNPNIYKTSENKKCIPSHYKGALVVAPNRDYHYYRENDDGKWSHKPGYKPSTFFDSNNNYIKNPRKAARDYGGTLHYKDFCGYLCVPRDERQKRIAEAKEAARLAKIKKRQEEEEFWEQMKMLAIIGGVVIIGGGAFIAMLAMV